MPDSNLTRFRHRLAELRPPGYVLTGRFGYVGLWDRSPDIFVVRAYHLHTGINRSLTVTLEAIKECASPEALAEHVLCTIMRRQPDV